MAASILMIKFSSSGATLKISCPYINILKDGMLNARKENEHVDTIKRERERVREREKHNKILVMYKSC